jgi:hypothetical protein
MLYKYTIPRFEICVLHWTAVSSAVFNNADFFCWHKSVRSYYLYWLLSSIACDSLRNILRVPQFTGRWKPVTKVSHSAGHWLSDKAHGYTRKAGWLSGCLTRCTVTHDRLVGSLVVWQGARLHTTGWLALWLSDKAHGYTRQAGWLAGWLIRWTVTHD